MENYNLLPDDESRVSWSGNGEGGVKVLLATLALVSPNDWANTSGDDAGFVFRVKNNNNTSVVIIRLLMLFW